MANRTVKDAHSIHGTNPQYLVEKIIRTRIYESKYWKEECFGLTGERERAGLGALGLGEEGRERRGHSDAGADCWPIASRAPSDPTLKGVWIGFSESFQVSR